MSTQKSRAEKAADRITEQFDDLSQEGYEATLRVCETRVEHENQDFWSLYRALDVSQSDVRDMVGTTVEPSQSTVSRVIRKKDDAVLTDPDAITVGGTLSEEDLDLYPEEWLEAYRQVIAQAHANLYALSEILEPSQQTPEWAARRFPELVGCHHIHERKLPGDHETVDDSHLNRLDSVNTDRWK